MKKTLSILLLIIFTLTNLKAQITAYPEYPTALEMVTIYFDATGTPLQNYTGNVYAHTGVGLSTGQIWQHVIGSWGNNTTQPQLTKISANYYSLSISPSIMSFYNVGGNEEVNKLCFVFRSADGTKQTSDLFYDVYSSELVVNLDTNQVFSLNDNVSVKSVALFADSIKIFIQDTLFASIDSTILDVEIPALNYNRNYFKVIAFNQTISNTVVSSFFVRALNNIEELPAGLEYGINYIDNQTVTLALYAPYKDFVFLIGDFNNWEIDNDYLMNLTPDSSVYWITLSNLTPLQEYAYQYYVDAEFSIADPYTDKILDPWNDSYIGSSTYPNLKPYPTKADGIVSVLQPAQVPYNWDITNFQRPEKQDLVIYELLIRDFISARNYQTLIDTISYLKNLGINAVELMPVSEFEGNSSWGYNPSFYFAPDKYYGTKNKLKEFIDSCHANGIAVIMDIVFNHSYGQSPLVQLYLDRETWKVTEENPWYNVNAPNPVYSWGYDFDHQSTQTRYFVDRAIDYWLTEYKIDGYRFDFTKGFTNTGGDGWAYDLSRINILKHYYDVAQNSSAGSYLILEHFAENSEETILANYGMLLWGNSNYNYAQASMGYSTENDFSWISYLQRGWNNPGVVGYMESHDEERMMYRNLTYGNSTSDYNIKELETALRRTELAAAFFFTVPGPKMIWEFEELGYDYTINYCENGTINESCRVSPKPIKWDYQNDFDRDRLKKIYTSLIELRKQYSIFNTNDFTMNTSGMVKQIILESDTADVVVIGNFDLSAQNVAPSFTQTGIWYEFFTDAQLNVTIGQSIRLNPGEYRIYSTFDMFNPEIPILQTAPQILSVSITGDTLLNDTLVATYTYFDLNNDNEAQSIYQWYVSSYSDGRTKRPIEGANAMSFIVTKEYYGKYIGFSVVPVSEGEELNTGIAYYSNFIGPFTYNTVEPTIFPNPFKDDLNFLNIKDYNQISISNSTGKLIERIDINANNIIQKNYSWLSRGVYIIKIEGDTKMLKFKVVKL